MATTLPGGRQATYEDVLRAPSNLIAEIIDGELELSPRPTGEHSSAATSATIQLGNFDRKPGSPHGPGGWWIRFEPEVHLGRDVLVPDIAGWRRERLPLAPTGPFTTVPPDFVAEVLSPSTASRDRLAKMRIYARENVRHVWLIDPQARLVEAYRLEGGQWLRIGAASGNTLARLEPFEAVELELERWWGETPDPPEVP